MIRKEKKDVLVAVILDKSGSMSSCDKATRDGFNEYMQELRKDKKSNYQVAVTLFDTDVEIGNFKALSKVDDLDKDNYQPNGSTALYDAVGGTLDELEKDVDDEKVLVVIMTDGGENASTEYKAADIHKRIKKLEKRGNWTFVFMGANQDSWAVGSTFGLSAQNVSNYNSTATGAGAAFRTLTANTVAYSSLKEMNTGAFFSKEDQKNLEATK